jgi:hypothetical protein
MMQAIAFGSADAITDQPTLALYVECSGWHTFSGPLRHPPTRALLSGTLDQWPVGT